MRKDAGKKKNSGFALIEALLAFVIFAFGLVALARFDGNLLHDSGTIKARDEAVTLAEQKLERFRNCIIKAQYQELADTGGEFSKSETLSGINTEFRRRWQIADENTPPRKVITVEVSWADPRDGAQVVSLSSILNWHDPLDSREIAERTPGSAGLRPPDGGAILGDKRYDAIPRGASDNGDGTSRYENSDHQIELIDNNTHEVELEVNEGDELVSIGGAVYIQANAAAPGTLGVAASGNSYCTTGAVTTFSRGSLFFQTFDYRCYMASGWYGSIGVLDLGNVGPTDQASGTCLGDPYSADTVLERRREYRGYDEQGNVTGVTAAKISALHGSNDFMIPTTTTMSGCVTAMTAGDPRAGDLSDETRFFYGDLPQRVCLTPGHCPEQSMVTLGGHFNFYGNARPGDITAIFPSGSPQPNCRLNAVAFRCDFNSLPEAGWNGTFTFLLRNGLQLCGQFNVHGAEALFTAIHHSLLQDVAVTSDLALCPPN